MLMDRMRHSNSGQRSTGGNRSGQATHHLSPRDAAQARGSLRALWSCFPVYFVFHRSHHAIFESRCDIITGGERAARVKLLNRYSGSRKQVRVGSRDRRLPVFAIFLSKGWRDLVDQTRTYDVFVVGSGASGGWAAKRLLEAGPKVDLVDVDLSFKDTTTTE